MSKLVETTGMILGAMAGEMTALPFVFMKSRTLMFHAPRICWNITDYGELSRFLIAGIESIQRHGVKWDALVRSYHKWLGRGYVELDMVSARAFGQDRLRAQVLRDRQETQEIGGLCSGQVLIRQIPLVIAGIHWSDETLCRQVRSEVLLTHRNEEVLWAAQIYALCMHYSVQGLSRVEIWDKLFENKLPTNVYQAVLKSYYEKPIGDGKNYSHANVTLQLSLYHFWHDTPYVSAIRSAILLGGATDVNAAAVGALLGTQHSAKMIPRVWRDQMFGDYEHPMILPLNRTLRRLERILEQRTQPDMGKETRTPLMNLVSSGNRITSRISPSLLRLRRGRPRRTVSGISLKYHQE